MIHPTAIVDATARLGEAVEVGPFAVIGAGVVVGDGCRIAAHAVLHSGSELGRAVVVDCFAVVAGAPQSRGECHRGGRVRIGDASVLREGVTVNMPTLADGHTAIGRNCMLMANSHVGHDSVVGDDVTIANCGLLAGHVQVGDRVFLGGGAAVHQFTRIGAGAMVGGNASISYDVPPFAIAAERNVVHGLNLVGIRRQGMPAAEIADLKRCYHAVYRDIGNLRERALAALAGTQLGVTPAGRAFLEFFAGGRRGFARSRPRGEEADPRPAAGGSAAETD